MSRSFAGLLGLGLFAVLTGAASAQPPDWMVDHPFMPHRGRIGVRVQPMTPELREFFKVPSETGVLVSHVEPDRPAAAAGLAVGDVITASGERPIREPFDLVRSVARVPAGEKLTLVVYREGEKQTLTVAPEGDATPWVDPEHWSDWVDEQLREGSGELRERLREFEKRLEELERRLDEKPV